MAGHAITEHEQQDRQAEAPEPGSQSEVHYGSSNMPTPNPPTVRNPLLAGFFSLFPGLGNVYNGLYLRGVTFFLICFGLIGLATDTQPPEAVLLVFTVIFTWLFNIFDAYRQATLINYGYAPDAELPDKPRIPTWGSGGLIAGVAVFVVGLYGFLRDRFDIDLAVLVDYWYVFFMAFGAFLIVQAARQWRSADETTAAEDTVG